MQHFMSTRVKLVVVLELTLEKIKYDILYLDIFHLMLKHLTLPTGEKCF